MLETKNLRFKYDDDSELSFPDIKTSKENLLILGASGVGKTTLLNLLSGLLKPLEGEIDLIGTPITGKGEIDATIPGKWAAPPAPAMITLTPLRCAFLA